MASLVVMVLAPMAGLPTTRSEERSAGACAVSWWWRPGPSFAVRQRPPELPLTRSEVSTAGACVWARPAVQGCRGVGKWRYVCGASVRDVRAIVCGLCGSVLCEQASARCERWRTGAVKPSHAVGLGEWDGNVTEGADRKRFLHVLHTLNVFADAM